MNSESWAAFETPIQLFSFLFYYFLFRSQDNTKLNELANKNA